MAYGFTKQSGGHLKIYSEEGSGTTVKIYLPRVLETGQPAPVEAEKPNLTGYAGQTVFLIEDNEDLRTTFRAQLKRLGFTVITASDGPTAIAQTSDVEKVDFILCDVILPNGMNGIEVVAELRKKFGAVPVVYMSGYTENANIHHGRLDDGVTLLQKPFTISELKIAFDKAFDAQG
jgi:CheY-like chemotaxis protein